MNRLGTFLFLLYLLDVVVEVDLPRVYKVEGVLANLFLIFICELDTLFYDKVSYIYY